MPYQNGELVEVTRAPALVGLACEVKASDGRWTTLSLKLFGREAGIAVETTKLRIFDAGAALR